ncbi:hypothetical protein HYH03_017261 [Edaphochlamys debaryana]|uniref:Uncharacterized protein n=1 Tax=Edaphochlamys debaryana TaxID=47281 RepID=A0A836BP44_9CHLO|nr:hypothetical protein HYH03_017261 [Edaphochlamys debaryana]|eukprot:KAG2483941.1 hypothetical protein HYH03_017261 [Edaphochlamys debaryana]
MTHSRTLVPITREYLRQFYVKFPLDPVPVGVLETHIAAVDGLAGQVTLAGSKMPELFGMQTPKRIDDCFWRNRMICEELALSLARLRSALAAQGAPAEALAAAERCGALLTAAEASVRAVQEHNTDSVKAQMKQFIPQDFRGAMLESRRAATEAKYGKQVADLVKRGGTVRQKYELYLQQQWERRQTLVALGECSGVYRVVVKWVAGIPQVLLDFAKEVNAKLGPMEEQRIKYGPDLYGITTLGFRLDVCLAAWAEAAEAAAKPAAAGAASAAAVAAAAALVETVEPAVQFYEQHMLRVVRFIGNVFQHSPFFVTKEDLAEHDGHAVPSSTAKDQGLAGAAKTATPPPASSASVTSLASASAASQADAKPAAAAAAAAEPAAVTNALPPVAAPVVVVAAEAAAGGGQLAKAASVQAPPTPPAAAGAALLPSMSDTSTPAGSAEAAGPLAAAAAADAQAAPPPAAPAAAARSAPPAAVTVPSFSGAAPSAPRPAPLGRAPTPAPGFHIPGFAGHGHNHPHPPHHPRESRGSITGDSEVGSFVSAEDGAEWHQPEQGYADERGDHRSPGGLLLGCFSLGRHAQTPPQPTPHAHGSSSSNGHGSGSGNGLGSPQPQQGQGQGQGQVAATGHVEAAPLVELGPIAE